MEYLRFDDKRLVKNIEQYLIVEIHEEFDKMSREILRGMNWEAGQNRAKIDKELKILEGAIDAVIHANAYVVLDSFGSGTKSAFSFSDEVYQEYRKSKYWNKLRTDRRIRGRARGTYTNFFGHRVKTKGRLAGQILHLRTIEPSGAIQDAWNDFFKFGLPIAVEKAMSKIDYSNYFEFR